MFSQNEFIKSSPGVLKYLLVLSVRIDVGQVVGQVVVQAVGPNFGADQKDFQFDASAKLAPRRWYIQPLRRLRPLLNFAP
jgi:hypothetical protein